MRSDQTRIASKVCHACRSDPQMAESFRSATCIVVDKDRGTGSDGDVLLASCDSHPPIRQDQIRRELRRRSPRCDNEAILSRSVTCRSPLVRLPFFKGLRLLNVLPFPVFAAPTPGRALKQRLAAINRSPREDRRFTRSPLIFIIRLAISAPEPSS